MGLALPGSEADPRALLAWPTARTVHRSADPASALVEGRTVQISVIGTGNIGGALAAAFARAGHAVTVGVRDPATAALAEDLAGSVAVADIAGAIAGADVVVLAVPGPAVAGLVAEHAAALDGRLLVDAANVIGGGGPANSHDAVTAAAPRARYARAFNTLGFENLREPRFGDERADMIFSASEADRESVAALIEAVGLRPVWLGEGTHDTVDGLLPLWFTLARTHGRHLAFRVLTDTGEV
jgi:predicted dinucleotide-binding enzyme